LYTLGIYILGFLLKLIAYINPKIKKGVLGRSLTFSKLKNNLSPNDQTLWFHCASLGEYEQGLPVFKGLRTDYPTHKIVLSFFSPSGYEVREDTEIADLVVYLPLDTPENASTFLDLVKPELIIFVKYDIWPNFLIEVGHRKLRAVLISAQFRKGQSYFKFYGNRLRRALSAFEHIFVQDESSKTLLNSINIKNVSKAGDTRYDRVYSQLKQNNHLDYISEFKKDSICIVIGSSWEEDETVLLNFINNNASKKLKFVIAPHEIKPNHIDRLRSGLTQKSLIFTEKNNKTLERYNVFIIDTVGQLSKIYSYADIAYVGGAMGSTGLHNILEPAVFGVPIIIGKNYEKFPEAKAMIREAGVTSINNEKDLNTVLRTLIENNEYRQKEGLKNLNFIEKNTGAVVQIMSYLRK